MERYLFLDDFRNPDDAQKYMKLDIYSRVNWDVVRNYDEFCDYILINGLPSLISFDHDLADEHYTPKEYWHDYQISKEYQDAQNYTEKTGKDCANWLVDYCLDNNLSLPKYYVHSANPVGADNILFLLDNFSKVVENKKG